MLKRLCAVLLAGLLTLLSFPAGLTAFAEEIVPPEGYLTAAENNHLALFYRTDRAAVAVLDKQTQKIWSSELPVDQYPEGELNEQTQQSFRSLLNLSYTLLNRTSSSQTTSPLETLEYELSATTVANGLTYIILIEEIHLRLSVTFVLDGNSLTVSLPSDGIEEGVGTVEQLQARILAVNTWIDDTLSQTESMQQDERLPKSVRKPLTQGVKTLQGIKDRLSSLDTAVGIEDECDWLLDQLNTVENYYINSPSQAGFFTGVQTSGEVDAAIKSEYAAKQSDFETDVMTARLTVSGMKTIQVGALTELEVMTYFGACGDRVNGFMLYPDGSGAITEFKENHGEYTSNFKVSTFSDASPDIDWALTASSVGIQSLASPYFGVCQEDAAFVGYITQGKSESTITFSPSGYTYNVNRINPGFVYRRTIAASASGGSWQGGQQPTAFETERIALDAEIRYMFLADADANYSGMARALRDYLQQNGQLIKNEGLSNGVPLALDLFGGYNRQVLVFNDFIVGTTFQDAQAIIQQLTKDRNIPLLINYIGFTGKGYDTYPSGRTVASKLGGLDGLQTLAQLISEKNGRLFLQNNHLLVDYDAGGYSEGDLTLGTNLRVVESADQTRYILSPTKVLERAKEDYLPFYAKTGAFGVTEDLLGSFVYYNYSREGTASRSDTTSIWQELLQADRDALSGVAVNGANEYVWPYADWIMNVPFSTSGYVYTDYGVPFYQMLVHGYIPYTGQPVNEYYDSDLQFMKMVEYGALPYFRLSMNELDASETGLPVSSYATCYEEIVDTYNRYAQDFSGIVDQRITLHQRNGDLVTVEYEDGTTVLFNYGTQPAEISGMTVEPMSYSISKAVGGEILEKDTQPVSAGEQNGVHFYSSVGFWILLVLLVSVGVLVGVGLFHHKKQRHV